MPSNNSISQSTKVLDFEESENFNKQYKQIRDESGFGLYEGGSFNAPDFAFFILFQKELKENKETAQKLHAPLGCMEVEYGGKQYSVKERTCLWTGEKLLILSSHHTAQGSSSLFRRAVTVPVSTEDLLQFYAMISTKYTGSTKSYRFQVYLEYLRRDYQASCKAYLYLYPYVRPHLLSYKSDESSQETIKGELILPALLTRSTGSWTTIDMMLSGRKELTAQGFLAIMGWFVCVLMLQKLSLVHCDMSDVNVTVFGPGVLCQLIDLSNLAHLNQEGVLISCNALSAYPDHCASNAAFDIHSDLFSVSMNILMHYALRHEPPHFPTHYEMKEMNEYTNKYFDRNHQERKNKYSLLYEELESLPVNKPYDNLAPYLLNFVHPDRDKRGPALNVFSHREIMGMIYEGVSMVIDSKHYASLFTDVGDLTLRDSIKLLRDNADQQGIAATSILLLLVYALHCHTLDEEVRIDHKKKIEMILEGMPLSPSCQTLLDRYETPFPGRRTDNLIDPAIDDSESEIIESPFKEAYYENIYTQCEATLQNLTARVEHLTNRQECKTILRQLSERVEHSANRQECKTTLQQLSERVEHLTNREKCKTTLQEQPNRVEKNSQKNDGESTLFSFAVNICLFDSAHTNSPEEVLSDCKSHTNHNR